jgi:hypothetical protein
MVPFLKKEFLKKMTLFEQTFFKMTLFEKRKKVSFFWYDFLSSLYRFFGPSVILKNNSNRKKCKKA